MPHSDAARVRAPAPAPVLVELEHGTRVESRHRGLAIVMNANGTVEAAWGDVSRSVCVRSAIKPLQAIALVESGAFAALGLSDEELALASASHSGEPMHVGRVRAWLERIGCSESDLACGPHDPSHAPSARALRASGEVAGRATNGCSGKHAGFLSIARHTGRPVAEYCVRDAPVQRQVISTVAELADLELDRLELNVDFCNAPNLFAPFERLALAFARMTDPDCAAVHGQAAGMVLDAMGRHPELIGGTDRFCTELTLAAGPGLIAKSGAEGAYVVFLRRERRALLVKIEDGADRAAPIVCCALLERMGALSPAACNALQRYRATPFVSSTGERIGVLRPSKELSRD
jgi:L-asparaginase II